MYYNITYMQITTQLQLYIILYIIQVSRETDPSNSDRLSSPSVRNIRGRANGKTSQDRGQGTAQDIECGTSMHVTSTTSYNSCPCGSCRNLESDQETLSVLYQYREIPGSKFH